MALGAIELVDSSGTILNPKGAAIQPVSATGPIGPDKLSPIESMQEVFFEIRDGINNLSDRLREEISGLNSHLAFRLETLNKTMQKIATVSAKDLDLEAESFEAEQDKALIDARDENISDNNIKADDNNTADKGGSGVLGKIGGAVGGAFSKVKGVSIGEKAKIALFAGIAVGLAATASSLNKVIAPVLKTIQQDIIPRIKVFFSTLKDDIAPIFENVVDFLKTAFSGITNVLKIFEGDFASFFTGMSQIFLELPVRLLSIIGDAFFSLIDAAFKALGIDAPYVEKIAEFFRELPETIKNAIKGVTDFFTVTIPEKFNEVVLFFTETIPTKLTEFRDMVVQGVEDLISFIVDPIIELKDSIMEKVDLGVEKIKTGITSVIDKIKNVFTRFTNSLKSMANAVIDKINLVLPEKFEISKFELTPINEEPANVKFEEKTGDAATAEAIALEDRAKVEGDAARQRDAIAARMSDMGTYYGYYNNPLNTKDYFRRTSEIEQDREYEINEGDVDRRIMESVKKSQELRAQGLLLPDAERALAAFEKANAMPPTVISNSTRTGDVTNQTQVSAGELSSDHSDATAKHLASNMD